jgi:crotonobetainyl-CoA:carnitine CoA-transferase CaiB-like acyl-CoA transferase
MKAVFEDVQVRHRGLQVDIPHPAGVDVPTVASPMRFSDTPVEYDRPPPLLGQHTREVLATVLGKTDADLDALAAAGVI